RRLNVEEPFGQGNSVVNLSLIKLNTKWNPALPKVVSEPVL
ncbi:hypothetical protein BA1DRAFT_02675, partial [Photorhabdus aegyptia]